MTLTEIAAVINAHLKRFERDPKINRMDAKYKTHPYYGAGAWRTGRFVYVTYVTYQGGASLTRNDAERYLAALDNGYIGRHYEALRKEHHDRQHLDPRFTGRPAPSQ